MRTTALITLLLATAFGGSRAQSASGCAEDQRDYSSLYDDDTVAYWQSRYTPNIRANFATLLSHLSDSEKAAVGDVRLITVDRDEDDPFAYYAEGPRITLSASSIKFFDEVAIAASWLVRHDYSIESLAYYGAVLKCRVPSAFAGGRYPRPLPTLGIPADALSDEWVDHLSQNVLKGAIMFTLAHELGHVLYKHQGGGTAAEKQNRELQADNFAIDMFRRMGTPPGGIETFFFVATYMSRNRGDYETDAEFRAWVADTASHPLSGRRLTALANALRDRPADFVRTEPNPTRALANLRNIAIQLSGLGPLIDDPLLSRHASVVGREIPLAELSPRRAGNSWIPKNLR